MRCTAGGRTDKWMPGDWHWIVDIARARGYGRAHARGERASGEKRERALQSTTTHGRRRRNARTRTLPRVGALTRARTHGRAARSSVRYAHARHRCTARRRRRLWCGDGRRASGKMSAHWSGRNMTWKIINMVRSGGDCSSGQRSAAARQCCRLTVKIYRRRRSRRCGFYRAQVPP